MGAEGFNAYEYECWHFEFEGWEALRVTGVGFGRSSSPPE